MEAPALPPEVLREKEIEERQKEEEKKKAAEAPPAPRASIFGAAKPVDTTAREREIEERLARERERAPKREERDKSTENQRYLVIFCFYKELQVGVSGLNMALS